MKELILTRGKVALVDDEDYERVKQYKWTLLYNPRNRKSYARRGSQRQGKNKTFYLHREILNAPNGLQVDHINGDGLDNRRANLRLASNSQNHQNMKVSRLSLIGLKGVRKTGVKGNRWAAYIHVNGRDLWLGTYGGPASAGRAYDDGARKYFGEFARPNFPAEQENA